MVLYDDPSLLKPCFFFFFKIISLGPKVMALISLIKASVYLVWARLQTLCLDSK